jgi:hypothetical protein
VGGAGGPGSGGGVDGAGGIGSGGGVDGEGATGSGDWLAGGMSSAHAQRMRHRHVSDHQISIRGMDILPKNEPRDVDYAPERSS